MDANLTSERANEFDSPEYKRSRTAYVLQAAFEYFITLFVSDAFLAKLLSEMGMSDTVIGILSSLASLAFLFQFINLFIAHRITNVKRFCIVLSTTCQLLFMSLYFIPFIPVSKEIKTALVIIGVVLAYLSNYLIYSLLFKWANSYVDPRKRASFSAIREMISLAGGMILSFIIGFIVDKFEAIGNIRGGFIFISISIFVLAVCNFISLMLIKGNKVEKEKRFRPTAKDILSNTLGNKSFLCVILIHSLWDIARYLTMGFLGIFKINDLLFTVGQVQIINIAGNAVRFALSRPIGKFSDKFSFVRGLELGLGLAALGFFANMFTTPENRWLIVVYTILYATATAGTNQNFQNVTFSYVKSEYYIHASAIKNSIAGILGFGASIVGSRILSFVQSNGNMIFGMHVYGQQVLSAISFVIIGITIIVTNFYLAKQKRMIQ